MRKALLIVAMLLLATPVMATTTITAIPETQFTAADGNKVQPVTICYSSVAGVDPCYIRAFALDINIDGNSTFANIRDFNKGEANGAVPGGKSGYGIFPSRFRSFIVVTGPNWIDPNYNPTTAWNEPGTTSHTWGMGFPQMIVEMGTLYNGDVNKPALSGTLFRFDVNAWGQTGTFNLTIAADALRGGVVNSDGNSISATFVGTPITFTPVCTNILNEVGVDKATAELAWTGQGFQPSGAAGSYSDTIPLNQVVTQDTGCFQPPHTVNYTYSKGPFPTPSEIIYPKWDSDSNIPIYWSPVAGATAYQLERSSNSGSSFTSTIYTGTATFKADSVAPAPNYRYRVLARNADSNSLYMTGTYDCNAYLSTCYKGGVTSDPNWANWLSAGRPDCWCKASTAQEPNGSGYQCDGDADGVTSGAPNNYRVYTGDLSIMSNNWKKKASDMTNDPNVTLAGKLKIHGACGNFSHKSSGSPNNYRVYTNDLSILSANWKKLNSSSVTATNKLPGNCPR